MIRPLSADFAVNVTGIKYQFFDINGPNGVPVTAGITNPVPGIYTAGNVETGNAIGVLWTCDDPDATAREEFEIDPNVVPPAPAQSSNKGPFLYFEPQAAGSTQPIKLSIQPGLFGNMNFSGVQISVSHYEEQDVDLAQPKLVKTYTADAFGLISRNIIAGDLGNGVLGAEYQNNLGFIGTATLMVSNFGRLARRLDDLLCAFRGIERFEEPGLLSEDRMSARWGWSKWHSDPEPTILRNSNEWMEQTSQLNGWAVDYTTGRVYFKNPLEEGEEVRANYSFRLLDLATYENFFRIALDLINAKKPQTSWAMGDYPPIVEGLLLLYGYVLACRMIIPKLSMFRFQRLFENPQQLLASLQTNMQTASSEFEAGLLTIKRRGLVNPAAVSSFNRGGQVGVLWDGINTMDTLVVGRV